MGHLIFFWHPVLASCFGILGWFELGFLDLCQKVSLHAKAGKFQCAGKTGRSRCCRAGRAVLAELV
jgi:hypothetical protein